MWLVLLEAEVAPSQSLVTLISVKIKIKLWHLARNNKVVFKIQEQFFVWNMSLYFLLDTVTTPCSQKLLVHLSDKMIASPQLWAVWSHQYTLEWPLNMVVTSQVLAVCHNTHQSGPSKKSHWGADGEQTKKEMIV